jgi:hypothetical protein
MKTLILARCRFDLKKFLKAIRDFGNDGRT